MSFDRTTAPPITPRDTTVSIEEQRQGRSGSSIPSITQIEASLSRVPEAYILPLSGGIAGAVSGFVSCPLDVIKTKLQAQGGFQATKDDIKRSTMAYRGVQGTAGMIWREEGVKGMYRGLGPMLLGYVPTWAVYLTIYNKAQKYFRTKTGGYRISPADGQD